MDQLNLSEFMNKKSDYNRTQELREKIKKLFKHSALRNSLGIELKGGILWGKEVELGEDIQVEKGAAILGKTKILKGKIEKSAIVIDCIIQEIEAKPKSMLFLVEQLDEEKVKAKKEQFLTDLIILDKGIIRKARVYSSIGEIIKNKIFNIDGREITFNKLLEKFPNEFNEDFQYNKDKVGKLTDTSTKIMRNRIAGYVTRYFIQLKQRAL